MANSLIDKNLFDNLNDEEKEYVLKILEEYEKTGESKIFNELIYEDYREIPVDIVTFITDDNYLGRAWKDAEGNIKLYPFWLEKLKELFPTSFDTIVNNLIESGARGLGKSEIAVTVCLYIMYRVMCLKDPLEFFHIKKTEKLCFAFMNLTLDLSKEVAVSKFQNTVQLSPWFMSKGSMTQRDNNPYWIPPDYIEIIVGSQSSHLIGKPVLFAFFDEISFIKNQDIDKQKAIAMDMIDTAIGGMKTRFIYNGKNYSFLVLASSKRSEKSFLETHMKKKLKSEKENVMIIDEPVWNVKPPETYCGKRFNVALGNKFLVSQVLDDNTDPKLFTDRGYKIISVPVEFRAEFLDDIDRALCDYAGISSSELTKYISGQALTDTINENLRNPFTKSIIEVGNDPNDKAQYYDYFDLSKVPSKMKWKPLYIHLDMSVSGDKTGIAGVWINGKKPSVDEMSQANDLFFTLAFNVSIKAPKGRQVSFEKNKNFIYWLKEQGFNIKGVSSDSFQSVETGQVLTSKGYNYKQISVDRVEPSTHICRPYQYFKTAIYEKRIEMYEDEVLRNEIVDLERNINTGKVDHPDGGAKDASDAVCGALFNASQSAEQFAYEYGESIDTIVDVSSGSSYTDDRQQLNIDFEQELMKAHFNMSQFSQGTDQLSHEQEKPKEYSGLLSGLM